MRKFKIITCTGTGMQQLLESNYQKGERLAHSIIVQMLAVASGGIGYLQLDLPLAETPAATNAIQLGPATATVPGPIFQYESHDPAWGDRIDLSEIWVEGAHSGDKMLVSWWEIPK